MAAIPFTLDIYYGADEKPLRGEVAVWRLSEGTDAESGALVLPEKKTYPVVDKTGAFTVLSLDPNVTYLFDTRRLGNTTISKGVRAKTMPASGAAKFSTTPDVTPVYPDAGILGDAFVTGLANNTASSFYGALTALFNASTPGSTADSATAANLSGGALSKAALGNQIATTGTPADLALAAKIGTLKAWAKDVDNLIAGAITYASGLVTSAVVEWPDGPPGVLTIDSRQPSTGAVTAYHVTRVVGSTTTTYTQPTITRDSSGNATNVPQITVA